MAVTAQGRTFTGMAYPDDAPVVVQDADVRRVHSLDIPAPLREFAADVLSAASGGQWWTLGEFQYEGEDYGTAVGRWTRAGVEYGVEKDM